MVPVGAIVAIVASRFMYKKGWLGESGETTYNAEETPEKVDTVEENADKVEEDNE